MSHEDQVVLTSRGSRTVLWAQLLILTLLLIGSFGVLLSAALHNGDLPAVLDPRLERLGDPKDSLPPVGPDSSLNPLLWLFEIGRLTAMLVYVVALFTLAFGVFAVLRSWHTGDRKAFRWLVVSTAVLLALVVLFVTPYGRDLHIWLLD
jgi:predicted lysophospholipase L1 biosynthesis ABC-type transport system permease subunit